MKMGLPMAGVSKLRGNLVDEESSAAGQSGNFRPMLERMSPAMGVLFCNEGYCCGERGTRHVWGEKPINCHLQGPKAGGKTLLTERACSLELDPSGIADACHVVFQVQVGPRLSRVLPRALLHRVVGGGGTKLG